MKVVQAFGMIQPGASDTQAVRTTFIIDPEGILRAMVYYPMSNGRFVDEFVRQVKALQTSDAQRSRCPRIGSREDLLRRPQVPLKPGCLKALTPRTGILDPRSVILA